MNRILPLIYPLLLLALAACGNRTQRGLRPEDTIALAPCPAFVADNAMEHIRRQCDFGPRVPGTDAWQECGDWIMEAFRSLGLEVTEQRAALTGWDGNTVPCRNIVARLNPQTRDRILLCAHWDSRPWADNDPDPANHRTPVPAANDGASGVAVMLEIARAVMNCAVPMRSGIDFVCFDAEDCGAPRWADEEVDNELTGSWCLGSTHWACQAASSGYSARFGILFDMVGGRGSTFSMEGVSREFADPIVQTLWQLAKQRGYGQYFPLRKGGYVTDDHVPVNVLARIPTLDIIPYHTDGPSSFGPTWHTLQDTPDNIDPNVLEAVGQSVLQLLYNDNAD